jgi:hypothetical protein
VAVVGAGGVVETLEKRIEFRAVAEGKDEREAEALGGIEWADALGAAGEDFGADVIRGELGGRVRAGERDCESEQDSARAPKRRGGKEPHGLFFGRR